MTDGARSCGSAPHRQTGSHSLASLAGKAGRTAADDGAGDGASDRSRDADPAATTVPCCTNAAADRGRTPGEGREATESAGAEGARC